MQMVYPRSSRSTCVHLWMGRRCWIGLLLLLLLLLQQLLLLQVEVSVQPLHLLELLHCMASLLDGEVAGGEAAETGRMDAPVVPSTASDPCVLDEELVMRENVTNVVLPRWLLDQRTVAFVGDELVNVFECHSSIVMAEDCHSNDGYERVLALLPLLRW